MIVKYSLGEAASVKIPGANKKDPVIHGHGISQKTGEGKRRSEEARSSGVQEFRRSGGAGVAGFWGELPTPPLFHGYGAGRGALPREPGVHVSRKMNTDPSGSHRTRIKESEKTVLKHARPVAQERPYHHRQRSPRATAVTTERTNTRKKRLIRFLNPQNHSEVNQDPCGLLSSHRRT